MTTLDFVSDDLTNSRAEQSLSFFDWMLTGPHNAHELPAVYKRRAYLPAGELLRLHLCRERVLRKAESRWA